MQLFLLLLVSLLINIVMFVIAYKQQTDKLTDISYAVSFITLALIGLVLHGVTPTKLLLTVMVIVWGLRLGSYLLTRIRRIGKDKRFDGIRNNFRKFAKFWISQGFAVWVILLPVLLVELKEDTTFAWTSLIGVAIWGAGLFIEATADKQKFAFINNPDNKGKWIESGIWRYSRHPNYLGEIMVWVGVYVAALPSLGPIESGVGIISPLFITCLLLFVSGVPPLERAANKRWGHLSAYHAYKARTSLVLLWPPKNS